MELDLENKALSQIVNVDRPPISEAQIRKFEGYMGEIFTAFGLDLTSPGARETPRRYIAALRDITEGYEGDPKLVTVFPNECPADNDCAINQIVEGPIPFFSLCEHHALPFFGQAYVGYLARNEIIGISKLTRLVRLYAKRFTVQERLGQQIGETLESILEPNGVAVYLEAHHLCTQMRGVREHASKTRTTFWRGNYNIEAALRAEFFEMCRARR